MKRSDKSKAHGAVISVVTFTCSILIIALILVAASHPALGFAGIALALLGGVALMFLFYAELAQEEKTVHESRRRIRRKAVKRGVDAIEERRMIAEEELKRERELRRREQERLEKMFAEREQRVPHHNMALSNFESLIEKLFEKMGYSLQSISRTDRRVDFVAAKGDDVVLINANNPQEGTESDVDEVYRSLGAAISQRVKKIFLITTSSFTHQAEEDARKVNESERDIEIELWNGRKLLEMAKTYLTVKEATEIGLPILPI